MTTLFAYVMTNDDGSAPNPFHDVCTLALCMPMTRGAAQPGDYVVGLAGKRLRAGGDWRIIYAMQVSEAMTFEEYRLDPRFRDKDDNVGQAVKGTNRVLIGKKFAYWGRKVLPVPPELGFLVPPFIPHAIGHRRFTDKVKVEEFHKWFARQKKGQLGDPTDWDERKKGC